MPVEPVPIRWDVRGAVITLPGEIDPFNSGQVRTALNEALTSAPAVLVADMTGTNFCCSEGLRVLLEARDAALQAHAALRVSGVRHFHVKRIFMLTGIDRILDMYPTTEAALAG